MKLRWKIVLLLLTALVYLQIELYWFATSVRDSPHSQRRADRISEPTKQPTDNSRQQLPISASPSLQPRVNARLPHHLETNAILPKKILTSSEKRAAVCRHFDQPPFDGKVRDSPGGTEREALQERRKLSQANWPLLPQASPLWRSRPRPVVDACLGSFLMTTAASEPSVMEAALSKCHNRVDFACLVAAVEEHLQLGGVSATCRNVYGAGLVEKFQRSQRPMCVGGEGDGRSGQAGAGIGCKSIRAHASHEVDTSICEARNFSIFFPAIEDGDFPWLKFSTGAFSVPCSVPPSARDSWHFMHSQADWMDLGFEATGDDGHGQRSRHLRCDEVVSMPTYFETRSGDYSPFAVTHDWLNTLLLYAVEGVDPAEVQVVLMDRMTVGFYTPMWQLGFSPALQLLWYPDLREKYQGKRVCFDKGWFNIPARLSPIYNEDDCGASAVYRLYSEYVSWVLGAHRTTPPADVLVVTLIVRRNYETGHPISRRFKNEGPLLSAMRQNFGEGVAVNAVDYAWFDFDQQLNISRATDVLVAMHGAGLVQMMYQPPWGGVFEFFCPEKPSSNYRYKQLAAKMGLSYAFFSIENDENDVPVLAAVKEMVKLVRHVRNMKTKVRGKA